MTETLQILFAQKHVGDLHYNRSNDTISLEYTTEWQEAEQSFPASLSLPIGERNHPDANLRSYLNGLLPDNNAILESWGKRFHVSPRNPFDLIKHVGEDCSGALQFVQPERTPLILSGELDELTLLSEEDLLETLADLKKAERAIPVFDGQGLFSLAGAQSKTALHYKDGHWHRPAGRIPTTHILKLEIEDFEEHGLNEHTCLTLSAQLGLPTATSELISIADQRVISTKRYDRQSTTTGFNRIHQEDFCQALAIEPTNKYESQGGPSIPNLVQVLRSHADYAKNDIDNLLRSLALNWAVLGTDAHAKNYSIIHGQDGYTGLAPFYDLSSFLPYRNEKSRKIKSAMRYGDTYHFHKIDREAWITLAKKTQLSSSHVLKTITIFLEKITENILGPVHSKVAQKTPSPFLDKLIEQIQLNTNRCLDELAP